MIRKLASISISVIALSMAAFSGAATAVPVSVDINVAPPAQRYEVVPAPRAGYLWTPGYWDWRGRRHVWVNGFWVQDRPGYFYSQPAWVQSGGYWHLNRGNWARRDRDGDGVPNRFDRRPGNPYRR